MCVCCTLEDGTAETPSGTVDCIRTDGCSWDKCGIPILADGGALGGYRGAVGGQHMVGSIINLLGMGLSILPVGGVDVNVDVGPAGTGIGVGNGGGALNLSNAALHCSRAPGMCNKCVANKTLYTLSNVTSSRPVYM